ncbi:IS200/IS605 family transposase [Bremerella sp. JC770]|uniref:IS200/IS605 family transposase n=1 Tax=Bremerella sp. JC770 TaxID=3232137 RepID=UPI00345A19A7
MPQSFACLYVHLIFSTKGRKAWLDDSWSPQLYEYFSGILRAQGNQLLLAGGVEDHVHLLISISRQIAFADLVRDLKANSSKWVRENHVGRGEFGWQAGYSAFSVSYSGLSDVRRYIQNQKEHHQKQDFREELIAFLKKHDVEYDERYVFD